MGYKRTPRVYKLVFEDEEYRGLEVKVRSMPLGQFMEVAELADGAENDQEKAKKLFQAFAAALVEWNLEEDGPDGNPWPVPADLDGLLRQDLEFVFYLIKEWMTAISGVNGPLAGSSTSGSNALEASLQMDPLS